MAQIRIWKLGSLERQIYPTAKAVEKLAEKIKEWDGKTDFDIVWGPELTLTIYDIDGKCDIDRIISEIAPEASYEVRVVPSDN